MCPTAAEESHFMTTTHCHTASMLKVGMRHQETLSFTREQVDQYCALCGDMNAIHHDLEAARLRFPGVRDIVVPGGLIQIAVTGIFGSRFPGDGCLGLTFTPERFRRPVCPGDEIRVEIQVTKIRSGLIEVEILIDDTSGSRLATATSKLLAADDAYRRWWESHRKATPTDQQPDLWEEPSA